MYWQLVAVCIIFAGISHAQQPTDQQAQLENPRLPEKLQRALFPTSDNPFRLSIKDVTSTSRVNNSAGLQLQADKAAFPILATLPGAGSAVYLTTLKPCGLILPHYHPRATEQYLVISGSMMGGLAEENLGRQNVTFQIDAGQTMLVPQGLLHYNSNRMCTPLVFAQIFNSADPGTLNVIGALASLNMVDGQSIGASNAGGVTASPQAAFALDPTCLANCKLPATGGDLSALSPELQTLFGLSNSAPTSMMMGGTPAPSMMMNGATPAAGMMMGSTPPSAGMMMNGMAPSAGMMMSGSAPTPAGMMMSGGAPPPANMMPGSSGR